MRPDKNKEAALMAILADQVNALTGGERPPPPPLNPGGVGGTPDGMEPRVAKLEAHMDHVRADLARLTDVPAQLAILTTKVDALPDKDWIGQHVRNWIIGIGGLLTIFNLAVTIGARFIAR